MRVFDQAEKDIIAKILHGEGYARNLINIIDRMSTLEGVRIHINRSRETAEFLFEIQRDEPSEKEITAAKEKWREILELLITHVTLLRYLEQQEMAVFFDPTTHKQDIIEFGRGASNKKILSMSIEDPTVIELLIWYIHKEIKPSPLLAQLEKNDYLTDAEIRFKQTQRATWSAIVISAGLGLYGIFSNHVSGTDEAAQLERQSLENVRLVEILSDRLKEMRATPIDYSSDIQAISEALSKMSEAASLPPEKETVYVTPSTDTAPQPPGPSKSE